MRYVFADCRWSLDDRGWGRAQYLAGHIPGAVFVDLARELSAPPGAGGGPPPPPAAVFVALEGELPAPPGAGGRHPLPSVDELARAMGAAGIDADAFVVAY